MNRPYKVKEDNRNDNIFAWIWSVKYPPSNLQRCVHSIFSLYDVMNIAL